MIDWEGKRVLALGAHADDVELGCGGVLRQAVEGGAVVEVLTFVGFGSPAVEVARDTQPGALRLLKVTRKDALQNAGMRGRALQGQEVLDCLLGRVRAFNPDVVFTHAEGDTHQDHEAVWAETVRATRRTPLVLAYGCPWNTPEAPNVFVGLSVGDQRAKQDAIEHYARAFRQNNLPVPAYLRPEAVEGRSVSAAVAGRLGAPCIYAEAFELIVSRVGL